MKQYTELPEQLRPLVRRTLMFVATMLRVRDVFYPFAAIREGDNFRCIFSDHESDATAPGELIEVLQWKLIDRVIDKPVQSVLAYAATVETSPGEWRDAVAVDVTDQYGNEFNYAFAYSVTSHGISFTGPLALND